MSDWNDKEPIYMQLRNRILHGIMTGSLAEGDAVPSVRQVAGDEHINPITVSKAYQILVNETLLETRRGLGMFVLPGARKRALATERSNFLVHEWPTIKARIHTLDLDPAELLQGED